MQTPQKLRSRYEVELDRLIGLIEAGGPWPPAGSDANALLKRAMRQDPTDRKDWAVARIAACRPDKLPRSRGQLKAQVEAAVVAIEQRGQWPPQGSQMAKRLADYLSPRSPRFRADIAKRIGDRPRPTRPSTRATRSQMSALVEEVVGPIERTGIFPRMTSPGGSEVRQWIRPSDRRFRGEVWRRLEACMPDVLDYEALAAERARIEDAVAAIEAGAAWPPRQSRAGDLIARAMAEGGFFYRADLVARLRAVDPRAVELAMLKKGRGGSLPKKNGAAQ